MNKKLGHDAIYDARELGVPRMLLLGLQHLFAMFGATVLVPILVQGYGLPLSIQTTLLFAGLGTLLFHVCTKLKVPAFLGSSFAYLGGFQAMATLNAGRYATMSDSDKLAYAMDTYGDRPEEAEQRVRQVDASRESYYHYLTRAKWGDLKRYHLSQNTSPIGKEGGADLIVQYAKLRRAKLGL